MRKDRTIRTQIQFTFVAILLVSIAATILTYAAAGIAFLVLQNKMLYPSNYYEKKLPAIEDYVRQQNIALLNNSSKAGLEKVIPSEGIVYQVVDGDGRILYGTYRTKVIDNRKQLYSRFNITSGYQGKYVLTVPIIGSDSKLSGAVLLAYELKLTSPDTNFRPWITGLSVLAVVAPFFYIILFTALFSRKLTRGITHPLQMLMTAARKIGERDLDFTIDYHSKNEIGKLCDAFAGMQEALKSSLSAQWKIEQERTEMVEALAHDLKTPMSVIQGYSEALLDSAPKDQEKIRKYLSVIQENAGKASNLVWEMQYSSELENSNAKLNFQNIDLIHFLEQKIQDYAMQAKKERIEVVTDLRGLKDTSYRIDPEKLERVLDNILYNSLQYTPVGGRIAIAAKDEPGKIFFEISDSGPGFDPKDLSMVFEKFYRGDTARSNSNGNSGLGLYIARQLIEKQGGYIRASNLEPHGANIVFTVRLF